MVSSSSRHSLAHFTSLSRLIDWTYWTPSLGDAHTDNNSLFTIRRHGPGCRSRFHPLADLSKFHQSIEEDTFGGCDTVSICCA